LGDVAFIFYLAKQGRPLERVQQHPHIHVKPINIGQPNQGREFKNE
jgi:hypothetical protein